MYGVSIMLPIQPRYHEMICPPSHLHIPSIKHCWPIQTKNNWMSAPPPSPHPTPPHFVPIINCFLPRVSYWYTTGWQFWHHTCKHGYHTCDRYWYILNCKFCSVRWRKWYTNINKIATIQLLQLCHHLNQIAHISSWSSPSCQLKHLQTKSNCYNSRNQDTRMHGWMKVGVGCEWMIEVVCPVKTRIQQLWT